MLRLRALDILKFMGEHGIRYARWRVNQAQDYMEQMINEKRVITIEDEEGLHTVILFSVCHDYTPFYKKKTYEYLPHDPSGTILYIEKAVSRGWTKELRKPMKDLFLTEYPQLQVAKWHRWGKRGDRPVTVRRERYVEV